MTQARPRKAQDWGHAQSPSASDGQDEEAGAFQSGNSPVPGEVRETSGLKLLLDVEAAARRASCPSDLHLVIANESRKLTSARQIFVLTCGETIKGEALRIVAISGLPRVERNAPLVQDIEHLVASAIDRQAIEASLMQVDGYPFAHLLWQPFIAASGKISGGMLLAREKPWQDADIAIVNRLGETYSHALRSFDHAPILPTRRWLQWGSTRKWLLAAVCLACLSLAIPVPMSILAPMEVIARDPFVVSSPIDGAIEEILVEPSEPVTEGQPIIRLGDTVLRNKLDLARKEVKVAEARLKKANQMAFGSEEGGQELRMAMADLELKHARLQFASDLFDRTTIRAPRTGHAVFSDKQGLTGKPVVVGEKIMQIADPGNVQVRIDVPVSDALVLRQGAGVKLFLDSDPVHARAATIRASDYQARPGPDDVLAFRAIADLAPDEETGKDLNPRLGARGTAQIYGDTTLLGFYLFRRPLAALRQYIGV